MAFGQYLTSIQNTLSKLFKTNEVDSTPLKVSPQPVAPIPDQDLAASQRASYEARGGLSPMGGNIPPVSSSPSPVSDPTEAAMNYLTQKLPPGQTMEQAYPATESNDFMQAINEADKLRPGLGNLLLLQAFFESNLGRTTPNIFGVKPQGESQYFEDPNAALQYQLSPNVLGGGVNDSLNILNKQDSLQEEEIRNMYNSYNPNSTYIDELLRVLFPQSGGE